MGDVINRMYETVADRQANRGLPSGDARRTRSGSLHRTRRSGSVDRIHFHENKHSTGYTERSIGHWDRHGNYSGR
ncbi:hypothetical protein [Aliikangiella coralliicola]|uniref:Uncharacterized protein n=1 Tax=Aliikangiella coralliicola TaxID=2592383 RepID=A0A545UCR0_9GAMM|nr:hypothetical protein [Aliikangiella coralliicola]TQV87254.1 hypothetical protein FLL46_12430 [Aliikangiella coralliicola]